MALLKTISGFRGTIGGFAGENLTPIDIINCTAAYGHWLKQRNSKPTVIVGRDGRISGPLVSSLAIQTLLSIGIDVIDAGLSTTPSVEMGVKYTNSDGGIIFTASHNPKQWNALKFLNHEGEFISKEAGQYILSKEAEGNIEFAQVDQIGQYKTIDNLIDLHIASILDLDIIKTDIIAAKNFTIVVDCINSTGAISIPPLLDKLNCKYILINEDINGDFAHNPEPLPSHLTDLSKAVIEHKADLGIAVDPDVDRLAFMCEDGSFFGEEYTLVAAADFVLSKTPGNTVSNLSSTRALADVTSNYDQSYQASAVGEVNVVSTMKASSAVIGGEGNGGVIYPKLHYGRDALVGIVFMLQLMAERAKTATELRREYPDYEIRKHKIELTKDLDVDNLLSKLKEKYSTERINTIDGLKIDMTDGWVHLRKSNTEPILRVYSESHSAEEADRLANMIIKDVELLK